MRIAISMRTAHATSYHELRDGLSREWSQLFARLLPESALVPVPNDEWASSRILEEMQPDALVLTGGDDPGSAPERDRVETSLLEYFMAAGKPVLAVCRGLQLINGFFGGKLTADLSTVCGEKHVACDHVVELSEVFTGLAGSDRIEVNSFHDLGVRAGGLGRDLEVFATAKGGVVEGAIHIEKPLLAIQWHPERPCPAASFDSEIIIRLLTRGAFWKE